MRAFDNEDDSADSVSKWLGDDLVRIEYQTYADDLAFEYEEPDLEFEQLQEMEAERNGGHGDDERSDELSGKYVPITEPCVARAYPAVSAATLARALQTEDLWNVDSKLRSALYQHFQTEVKTRIRDALRKEANEYGKAVQRHKIGVWEQDAAMLQTAKVIGTTTTGLGKYRGLLASLKPRIILIEEAAETLEGQIAAGCIESLEHLILVGDHKQLPPSCAVPELEGHPYHLGTSMFERLVRNGVEYARLARQRRMIPEIRRVLTPIYGTLEDHPIVHGREDVPGMGGVNSFLFTHSWPESRDGLSSSRNLNEAAMVVGLFSHLVLNGMSSDHITVLTFYNGQRKEILRALRKHRTLGALYFKVKTVDSYQGRRRFGSLRWGPAI